MFENIGASAEYVRDGLVYDNWKKNLIQVIEAQTIKLVVIMPEDLKAQAKQKLADWFQNKQHLPVLHEMEKFSIQCVIDYLDVVKTPHRDTSDSSPLWKDLRNYLRQYDQRRKKELLRSPHPTFTNWANQIEA